MLHTKNYSYIFFITFLFFYLENEQKKGILVQKRKKY